MTALAHGAIESPRKSPPRAFLLLHSVRAMVFIAIYISQCCARNKPITHIIAVAADTAHIIKSLNVIGSNMFLVPFLISEVFA